jgi:hypothetical protein
MVEHMRYLYICFPEHLWTFIYTRKWHAQFALSAIFLFVIADVLHEKQGQGWYCTVYLTISGVVMTKFLYFVGTAASRKDSTQVESTQTCSS